MKNRFAKTVDNLFFAVAIWLFSALVGLYYLDKLYHVVLVAFSTTFFVLFFVRIKNKKFKQLEIDKYFADLCAQHFLYNDDIYAIEYCYSALSTRYNVTKNSFYLMINDTVIVPHLTEPLTLKKLVFFYANALRLKAKTVVILTFKTEKLPFNLSQKLSDIRLEIFDDLKTYYLLKSLKSLPKIEKPLKGLKIKAFITAAFSKKRAKGYLITAFFLLFGAYFSVFSLYLAIMSAVCLTMVILCKLNIAQKK